MYLCNKTGNANTSFWCIVKTTNLKIRLWNQHSIQDGLARARPLVRTGKVLTQNFPNCIGDMVTDQFKLFLFWKTWKYPSTSSKEEKCPRRQFSKTILWLTVRLWDSSQIPQSHCRTKRLSRSVIPWVCSESLSCVSYMC